MGKIADTTRSWSLAQEQRRQILAFDVELEDAQEKVRLLQAQVLDLDKQVQPLKRDVERLEKQLNEQTAKADRAAKLAAYKEGKEEEFPGKLSDLDHELLSFIAHVEACDEGRYRCIGGI
jgi:predicted  nucleic acid-binding Zn-ribbon protein